MSIAPIQKILFAFLLLCAVKSYGQQDLKSFNIFGQADFFISGKVQSGNTYVFTLFKSKDAVNPIDPASNVTFTLRPLTKQTFIQNFFSSIATFKDNVNAPADKFPSAKNLKYDATRLDSLKEPDYKKLEAEASRLFYMFMAGSIVLEDLNTEPVAGTICFVDDFKILRRDFNRHSLTHGTKELWKVYKSDRKLVNSLRDNEDLDAFLKSDKMISDSSFFALMDTLLRTRNEFLSRIFFREELLTRPNKRKILSMKDKEFLQREAVNRQNRYDEVLRELNRIEAEINEKDQDLIRHNNTSESIGSLRLFENRRQTFHEKLKNDHSRILHRKQDILDMDGHIWLSIKAKLEIKDFQGINFNEVKETLAALKKAVENFSGCIYSEDYDQIQFEKSNCNAWSSLVDQEIRKGTNVFNSALLEEERESIAISTGLAEIRNKNDSPIPDTTIDRVTQLRKDSSRLVENVALLTSIVGKYERLKAMRGDSIYNSFASYRTTADEIVRLKERQLIVTDQIGLPSYRERIRVRLDNLIGNPVFFTGNRVSIPGSLKQASLAASATLVSKKLISELDTLERELGETISSIKKDLDTLKGKKENQQLNLKRKEDQLIFKAFTVDSIIMEINEGFIENILMVGKVNEYANKYGQIKIEKGQAVSSSRTLKFENSSPIGFSRKLDFDALKGKKIYTRGGGRTQYETYLEDVISIYIQTHQVGRRDYSPANQIVTYTKGGGTSLCQELKKDATYRLFEAKIFSDFVGLDETEPNGLIQTEISKRINLLTSRKPFQFFSLAGLSNEWNLGFFSFLEPSLTLSKIENNNKFLKLDNKDRFINNQYSPIKFTSTLALKQFENFSAGATANLLLLDMPNIKSTFFVNWGFRYGRTGVQDSIRTATPDGTVQVNANGVNEFGVNTFDHAPEIMWNIYADERYGFSMSWQHHWFYLRDNSFEQVGNTASFADQVINSTRKSRQFNTFRFLTTLEQTSNNKGRLFFRYTYNWQQGFWRTGFHQAQVGYSFFLLGQRPD